MQKVLQGRIHLIQQDRKWNRFATYLSVTRIGTKGILDTSYTTVMLHYQLRVTY